MLILTVVVILLMNCFKLGFFLDISEYSYELKMCFSITD
jgi:hypothetical protein